MSSRVLQPLQFLHGSREHQFSPGDLVTSPQSRGEGDETHSYFTTDHNVASFYAGRTYRVEPTGPYTIDHDEDHAFKSEHPLRVVGEHRGSRGSRDMDLDAAMASYAARRPQS